MNDLRAHFAGRKVSIPPARLAGCVALLDLLRGYRLQLLGWELLESSPSERLLPPMPQPRTVIATEPVSKRTVAFPVAGMVMTPAAVPRVAAAAFPARGEAWDPKAAREKTRARFLKEKAERAAKLQSA